MKMEQKTESDPHFSLVKDAEDGVTYYGVAWQNEGTFGTTFKINLSKDVLEGDTLRMIARKGFQLDLARESGKKPSFNILVGRIKGDEKWVGKGRSVKNKWNQYEIHITFTKNVPAGLILFCNPREGEENICTPPK